MAAGARAGGGADRGCFIAFEGPEGAGKSLQIERLSRRLSECGVPYVTTREPGGTAAAEAIREVILERPELRLDGIAELLLFSASRRMHAEEIIRPALERGDVVLCDRFELSTRVYQGCARGVPAETIRRVTSAATGGLLPDLYVVLDVPVSVGFSRQLERLSDPEQLGLFGLPDRIELEKRRFMERVRTGYLELAASDERIETVDGVGTPDEVERRVGSLVARRFPTRFG
ncbi:dTMP kinase [Candidatus Palauibacter sp.]|uniref:dTMP kinase n=1 Tax=Candidatus Palauibacter sp. TaxID=3101350 RepID=UPI003AF2CF08